MEGEEMDSESRNADEDRRKQAKETIVESIVDDIKTAASWLAMIIFWGVLILVVVAVIMWALKTLGL
jgi:hypothetical protein